MERYFWTTKELAIVKAHYPAGGTADCLPLLPRRTKDGIYGQAHKLGLMYRDNKPRPRKSWFATDEIDRQIITCYQTKPEMDSVKTLAALLRRPYWWVKKRASFLGVARPLTPGGKKLEWSGQELELLEKHATKNPEVIARIFRKNGYRRTSTAIVIKLKRMAFDTVDIDLYCARSLGRAFGVDVKVVIRWIENGWLKARRRGTKRTAQQGGDMWWVKRKDVRNFVIENVAAVDIRKVDKDWFVDLLANA